MNKMPKNITVVCIYIANVIFAMKELELLSAAAQADRLLKTNFIEVMKTAII